MMLTHLIRTHSTMYLTPFNTSHLMVRLSTCLNDSNPCARSAITVLPTTGLSHFKTPDIMTSLPYSIFLAVSLMSANPFKTISAAIAFQSIFALKQTVKHVLSALFKYSAALVSDTRSSTSNTLAEQKLCDITSKFANMDIYPVRSTSFFQLSID